MTWRTEIDMVTSGESDDDDFEASASPPPPEFRPRVARRTNGNTIRVMST